MMKCFRKAAPWIYRRSPPRPLSAVRRELRFLSAKSTRQSTRGIYFAVRSEDFTHLGQLCEWTGPGFGLRTKMYPGRDEGPRTGDRREPARRTAGRRPALDVSM